MFHELFSRCYNDSVRSLTHVGIFSFISPAETRNIRGQWLRSVLILYSLVRNSDLSENFEYAMAKLANRQSRSRISYLEGLVRNATVIEDDTASDEVGLNKRVTIFTEDEKQEETYKIVSSIRSSSLENRISPESPLGKALMHHKVGDRVQVVVNEQFSYYAVIRKIETVEDDGSDPLRQF